jgi:hypothetical protein
VNVLTRDKCMSWLAIICIGGGDESGELGPTSARKMWSQSQFYG